MAADMWFRDDVRNVLLGLNTASLALAASTEYQEGSAFQRGFQAALLATAVSFGIISHEIVTTEAPAQIFGDGAAEILTASSRE